MLEQVFQMSCDIKPKWCRWNIRDKEFDEDMIEANIIFTVWKQNIHTIPKLISLLGSMRVIVALPPK